MASTSANSKQFKYQILFIMFTPKNKHPILGYARSSKNKNRLSNDLQTSNRADHNNPKSQSTNNLIYNALMSQISQDHSSYMRRLQKECGQRKSQSHLRSKTIKTVGSSPAKEHSPEANSRILITPTNSNKEYHTVTPKAGNSTATLKHTQRFFSRNFQQYDRGSPHHEILQHVDQKDDKFLHFLDNYVGVLSRQDQKSSISSQYQSQQALQNKLNLYQYKFKQLQHFHQSQIKKHTKKEKLMKNKLLQMNEQIIDLTIRLKHQHQQRKRFQRLFLEHQKQLKLMKHAINRNDLDLSSFSSKDYDFSITSQLQEQFEFDNFKRFQKSSIRQVKQREKERQKQKEQEKYKQRQKDIDRDSQIEMNTSQKISRFLRKPFNDVRSTKPGISVSDQEEIY